MQNAQNLYSQQIRDILKVDLHRHLDCSVRWSTLLELAPQVGISLPLDTRAHKEEFLITSPLRDLSSVLKKFLNTQKILASEEILSRIAYEACEDAFNDGIRLLELRYAPSFISDGHPHLNNEKIHLAILKGIEQAQKKWPLAVGLICIVQRIKSYAIADQITSFAIDHKDSFIALDLADDEDGFDPKYFAPLFQRARKAGLHITIHSGEVPKPFAAQWVRDSIEILGAERIGHGVQIITDPKILTFVREQRIPLEVCPISNWLVQAFPSHEAHPVQKLVEAGILVTINSDDPGVFATTLSDDYEILHRVHGWGLADFTRANQIALAASFLPEAEKKRIQL